MRDAFVLFICIIYFLTIAGAGELPKTYNTATWMEEMKPVIYEKSLLEIQLPGTHDSGAYEFGDELSPVDPRILDDLIKIAHDLGIDIYQFIKNWSQTQDTTIYEQLTGGIRYLDLRACWIGNDWFTQHFLVGTRTQDLLNDIQAFMAQSTGEIVVVEMGELIPTNQELSLITMIQKTLGPFLAPRMNLAETTIGQMVKDNQRIIMLFPGGNYTQNYTFLWDKGSYKVGSYANQDKLDAMEQWNINEITTQGGNGYIFELSWTLTTQDSDIVRTLLDPFKRKEDLKTFALEADAALDPFQLNYKNFMLGNLLLVDWWEYSNVVELVIQQNLRNCTDDYAFVPVNTEKQYCRAFFANSNCTDPRYTDWMSVHCRLSCGFC